jgi:Rrf2 family protein
VSHFGSGVEYALHCLLHLVRAPGESPPSSRDLAEFQGIPAAYVAKIFSELEKAGVVAANEGIHGGFRLARPADRITVLDVVDAVEGDKPLFRCREIRRNCVLYEDRPPRWATSGLCAVHAVMREAENRMRDTLAKTTLADLDARFAGKVPTEFLTGKRDWFDQRRAQRQSARGARPQNQEETQA